MVEEFVGGYRLVNRMTTGHSSQTWEVMDVSGEHRFCMKILLPEKAGDKQQQRLLFHEAEVGKQLSHPNLLKIIDVSKDRKMPFLITEYFPVTSMKVRILKKQLDFIKQHALAIFQQAATALAYLNTCGWIHRAVKPDNILVNTTGEVRVADFALAQRLQKPSFFARLFRRKGTTQGTRSYMSPEQIRGEDLDERADVYSFGASLYEIVALRPPFRASSDQELLNKHISEKPITPQVHNPEVTEDFSMFVLDMLAKQREKRPRDFHQVLAKLRTIRVYKSGTALRSGQD